MRAALLLPALLLAASPAAAADHPTVYKTDCPEFNPKHPRKPKLGKARPDLLPRYKEMLPRILKDGLERVMTVNPDYALGMLDLAKGKTLTVDCGADEYGNSPLYDPDRRTLYLGPYVVGDFIKGLEGDAMALQQSKTMIFHEYLHFLDFHMVPVALHGDNATNGGIFGNHVAMDSVYACSSFAYPDWRKGIGGGNPAAPPEAKRKAMMTACLTCARGRAGPSGAALAPAAGKDKPMREKTCAAVVDRLGLSGIDPFGALQRAGR